MLHRIAYRLYRATSTLRHIALRRLTAGGWVVLVGVVLTSGMAMDADQSIGYQGFTFLVCLALAALACAPFFRTRFAAERILPPFGTAGQPLHYNITIRNTGRTLQAGLFVFDNLADPRPTFDEFRRETKSTRKRRSFRVATAAPLPRMSAPRHQPLPSVIPGEEGFVEMSVVPLKRGMLHFGSVSLAGTDPFMLLRAFVTKKLSGAVTILPRRYPLPNITLPGTTRNQQGGVSFASSVGESEEFIALRDYRDGDPLRRIHWRSWAKAGKPVVKEFQDEFFVRHALILDTFTEPDNLDLFEEAVSVAASFACTLDTQESLLDLLFVGPEAYCFTVGRGIGQADRMLEILASVQTCLDQSFGALQQIVIEHSALVSGCICIFVAWDSERQELVRKLEALGVPVLVLVLCEAEVSAGDSKISSPVHYIRVGRVAEDLSKL